MNQAQMLAVQEILAKRFPNMDRYMRFAIALEISEAIANKAGPSTWQGEERQKVTEVAEKLKKAKDDDTQ